MAKLCLIILLLISVPSSILAHCGVCGVGGAAQKESAYHKSGTFNIKGLTAKQEKSLKKITEKYYKKKRELMTQKRSLEKEYYDNVESILNDDQFRDYLIQALTEKKHHH